MTLHHKLVNLCGGLSLSVLLLSGCMTSSAGSALRTDVDALDARVSRNEDAIGTRVETLKQVLDEATQLLKRNSADLGAEVERIDDELRGVRGMANISNHSIEDLKRELAATQAKVQALEEKLGTIEQKTNETPDALYTTGKRAYDAKRWAEARAAFAKIQLRFSSHEKADDALYYSGESYFIEGQYAEAIREWQRLFDRHPDSSWADDALFRAGEAAEVLKQCNEARAYYVVLKKKYPKSSFYKQASSREKAVKANAKDKSICDN